MSKQVTMYCDLCGKNINGTFFRYSIKACHLVDGEVEECENYYMNKFDTAFDLCGDCLITIENLREERMERLFQKKQDGNENDKQRSF